MLLGSFSEHASVHSFLVLVCDVSLLEARLQKKLTVRPVYYMTTFYNRSQLASRTAIMYSGSQMGNAFGNLIAIGILKLDGYHGIAGWRWLFLIEGVISK